MLIIFGGSFNPPTLAHKEVISKLKEKYKETKIIIVPTSSNNYTWKNNLANNIDRYNMLKLAFSDIEISDYEFKQEKYLGTYQMLNDFKSLDSDIYFIMGSDNLNQMPRWLNYDKLASEFKFIILNRPGNLIDLSNNQYKDNFTVIEMNNDISATAVRENIEKNKKYLEPAVYKYIVEHRLYEVK